MIWKLLGFVSKLSDENLCHLYTLPNPRGRGRWLLVRPKPLDVSRTPETEITVT